MVVNTGTLPKGAYLSLSFSESFSVPAEYGLASDGVELTVEAVLHENSGEYALRGKGESRLSTVCAKCLKPVECHCSFDIDEMYARQSTDANKDIWLFSGDELDLSPSLGSCLLLNLPLKVVCSEGCQGLCPVCGGDMNAVNCECETRLPDPRFDALRTLIVNKEV